MCFNIEAIIMIDSTTKKRVIVNQKNNLISVKLYSWADMPRLEDHLDDNLQIEIEAFKFIKDEKGNEIGSELFFPVVHTRQFVQEVIDKIS